MKRLHKTLAAGLGLSIILITGVGAETVSTLVGKMPLKSVQTETGSFDALLALGADGLKELAGMLQPAETGGDAQVRYLISGVTHYAARPDAGESRTRVEQAWLAALESNDDREIKAFFIRRLQQCGTSASRDALLAQLADATLTEPAAQALLAIDTPGTAEGFLTALKEGQGQTLTLIQSLGVLKESRAAKAIRPLAASADGAIHSAALDALAAIGPVKGKIRWDKQSFALLSDACQTTNRFEKSHAISRCLRYAERAIALGATKQARSATQSVLTMSKSAAMPAIHAAGLAALTRLDREAGLAAVVASIKGDDRALSIAGVKLLVRLGDDGAKDLVDIITTAAPHVRAAAIDVLHPGVSQSVTDAVINAIQDTDAAVRVSAVSAAARLTDRDGLAAIIAALDTPDPSVVSAVENALLSVILQEDMPHLTAALKTVAPDARVMLLNVLGKRRASSALTAVLAATSDADAKVRKTAFTVLGTVVTADDFSTLLSMYTSSGEATLQRAAGRAVVSVIREETESAPLFEAIQNAYTQGDAKARLAIVEVLPGIAGEAALQQVIAATKDADAKVKDAAVRVLSKWPDDIAADAMLSSLKTSEELAQQVLLVRGLTRVVQAGKRTPQAKFELYRDALAAAPRAEEKGMLQGLMDQIHPPPAPTAPIEEGFVSIFNGKDHTGWVGDTKGYVVENGTLVCKPGGNIYTEQEYSDFVLRFEFQLTAGANNGLGIRTPTKGNAAYAGMELQILDNTAPKFATLKPWQYHGSIYGLVPAKRGHLKPVGEWNSQEVTANGSRITIVLNGTTIVDADLATLKQTEDIDPFAKHTGMHNATGHIGFLGHGAVVAFRNLRIKELATEGVTPPEGFEALFNGKDLAGWWGLGTEHYNKYVNLSPEMFEARKTKSRENIQAHWRVENGELVNDGKGLYLTTDTFYGDFELLVDYKTVPRADSGIYLRGCPQVQIWDYTEAGKFKLGADKGSGGLWNNAKGAPGKDPLVMADKPFGEWNSFRIKMIGDEVTIHLNDKLVVDKAKLHNYFDRKSPVPETGPIQLQTHGGEIRWRNVFIREL